MKKNLIKLLAIIMSLGTLAGCVKNEPDGNSGNPYILTIDGYSIHEMAMVYLTDSNGEALETGSIDFEIVAGKTVNEIMEAGNYTFEKAFCEYDTLEGWLQYEVVIETGDDGFDTYTYELISDQVLSTDEMLSTVIDGDKNITFAAKWKGLATEEYYPEEGVESGDEGYTGVIALSSAGGTISFINGDEAYYQSEASIMGFAEGENNLADSFANSDYSIEVTKEGKTLKSWRVYKADSLILTENESDSFMKFGEIEGTLYNVGLSNGELVDENMSTEDLEKLEPGSQAYLAIANWE